MPRFALIGAAGYIAPRHMRAIRDVGGELVVACDANDSVGVIDSLAPDAQFFTDFERFEAYCYALQRAGRGVDYVGICSPNHLHHAHIAAALRLGCSAICEKPLVLDCASLDDLVLLERESGKRVNTILQLRLHSAIAALREEVAQSAGRWKHEVELTYITSRGNWYGESWKADTRRSGGLAMNIGIHFFDMLHYVFGDLQRSTLHVAEERRMAGFLEYDRARVRWFLSIDSADLPEQTPAQQSTYRSITVGGREVEFSGGFTDLHSVSYRKVLAGEGFGLEDARPSIETVERLRASAPSPADPEEAHPWLLGRDRPLKAASA